MQEFFNVKMIVTQHMAGRLAEMEGPTFGKISKYVRNLSFDDDYRVIQCDLGGALGIDRKHKGRRNPSITAMNYMDYNFGALNRNDLSNISKLRRALGFSKFPFMSSNLGHPNTKEPFFGEPYQMLEINGMRLAMTSAYGGDFIPEEDRPDKTILTSRTIASLKRTLRFIYDNEEPDYVIVLVSDCGRNEAEIIEGLEGVGLVITGGPLDEDVVAEDTSDTYLAEDVGVVPMYHHHHTGHVMTIDLRFKRRTTTFEYIGHSVHNNDQEIGNFNEDLSLVDQIYYHI